MVDLTDRSIVLKWLSLLAVRCMPKKQEDIELQVRMYAPGLAKDIPKRAFCDEALEGISRQFEFFPAYAALRKAIDKWLDRNPVVKALPGVSVELPDMRAEDRANVTVWLQHDAAGDLTEEEMVIRLSVIRRYAPAGYRWLINANDRAAQIAVTRRWHDAPAQRYEPMSEEEDAELTQIMQPFHAPITAATKPENWPKPPNPLHTQAAVAATKPRPGVDFTAAFEAKHGRKPGALSPERLHAMRMENPALRAVAERQAQAQPLETPPAQDAPAPFAEVVSAVKAAPVVHARKATGRLQWD